MVKSEALPKVSVCVITYNQARYIRQCLQSIVDQKTDFDFEIIVGDDCSTDGTREIVKEFAEKYPGLIKPIYQEKNIGSGGYNFLTVHRAAMGDYVAHIDGDDYALPGKLQAQAMILDSMSDCTAVWHRVDYFDDIGGFCSGHTSDLSCFANGVVSFDQVARLGFVGVHSSLMYRRSAREQVPLDRKIMDIYVTWDLLSKGSGYILDEVFGRYRVASAGSLTISSGKKVAELVIEYANYFVKMYPNQRRNYFIWAVSTAIIHAKNSRITAIYFIRFALKNISLVSPQEIVSNMFNMRMIPVRWSERGSVAMKES